MRTVRTARIVPGVALFNHSGRQGKALHRPVPIRDIRIELKPHGEVRAVRLLQTDSMLGFSPGGSGRVSVIVPQLDHYEIVLFERAE